jgi:hypothetical protein
MQDDLEVARDLRNAAGYLREHGWQQGSMGRKGGPMCLGGALWECVGRTRPIGSFSAALGIGHPQEPILALDWGGVAYWNDRPGRTLDEVLDRLESAALNLEIRHLAKQPAAPLPVKELVSA